MKNTMLLFFCFTLLVSCSVEAQQPHSFDIVSYTLPAGWSQSVNQEIASLSKEDANGNYCVITLCKSVDAGSDAKANFNQSWEKIAQQNLGAGAVTMQPGTSDNGWETLMGSAPFEKDGLTGAAILVTSSKNNKMVNILILTNSEAYLQEMEAFLASVTLKQIPTENNKVTKPGTTVSSNAVKGKPELWQFRRQHSVYTNMDGSIEKFPAINTDYLVLYPNGDYLKNPPYEGLIGLDKSYATDSWGKFTLKGNKGLFKNKYDELPVTKKSATHFERDGYVAGIYKCLPVDGLRIEGAYTHVSPEWGKDPQLNYLNDAGCQYVIYFKKDGTFDDRGIFSTSAGGCTSCNCEGGKGSYQIHNFTITLTYENGRVVERLFSAPPTRNPFQYNETYYLGGTAYYKKQ